MKKSLLALVLASILVGLTPEVFAAGTVSTSTTTWKLPIFKKKKTAKLSRAATAKKYNPVVKRAKKGTSKPKRNW
ncbi:hypothetical protein [Nibribacter koreensis]|uniref:hypothetical protein n=1 Tax=Nibribacter koreensis TaxID=1084519 RepID=UPI0031E9C07D